MIIFCFPPFITAPSTRNFFDATITRTQNALSHPAHPHIGAQLRGLLWYQGETDAMDESLARDYHKKLSQLFQAFREKLGQLHVCLTMHIFKA
jgi:hypothetical protein